MRFYEREKTPLLGSDNCDVIDSSRAEKRYHRFRLLTLLIAMVVLGSIMSSHYSDTIVARYFDTTPQFVHTIAGLLTPSQSDMRPRIFQELIGARWMGDWGIPNVSLPASEENVHLTSRDQEDTTTTFLKLHIFSTSSPEAAARRQLIRSLNLLSLIQPHLRKLVEIRFIVGNPMTPWYPDQQKRTPMLRAEGIDRALRYRQIVNESAGMGDVIILDNLYDGENMDDGKSWEWLRYIGREEASTSSWVIKCDDDTMPLLPNIFELLETLDPQTPTYLGTALRYNRGYPYYFEGAMYGFSGGVVKTIASANVSADLRNAAMYEDARIGSLMFSLPSKPDFDGPVPTTHPKTSSKYPPPSPDQRTGLVRLDLGHRIGRFGHYWIAGVERALGWHGVKLDREYVKAFRLAKEAFVGDEEQTVETCVH